MWFTYVFLNSHHIDGGAFIKGYVIFLRPWVNCRKVLLCREPLANLRTFSLNGDRNSGYIRYSLLGVLLPHTWFSNSCDSKEALGVICSIPSNVLWGKGVGHFCFEGEKLFWKHFNLLFQVPYLFSEDNICLTTMVVLSKHYPLGWKCAFTQSLIVFESRNFI